jgi:glycosyltransferase involved in cell wall biosynthesis
MEALTATLGIRGRVRFLGQRTDVDRLLAQAQVGVLVSKWEGFPLSILEEMRAGLPVVASRVGGVDEAVQDGKTGFVVPREDVGELRDRLRRVLQSPELRLQLGASGRERYEQQFTLEHMVAKTLAVYREVLRGPGAASVSGEGLKPRDSASSAPTGDQLAVGG